MMPENSENDRICKQREQGAALPQQPLDTGQQEEAALERALSKGDGAKQ